MVGGFFRSEARDALDAVRKASTRSVGATAKAADTIVLGAAIVPFAVGETEPR